MRRPRLKRIEKLTRLRDKSWKQPFLGVGAENATIVMRVRARRE